MDKDSSMDNEAHLFSEISDALNNAENEARLLVDKAPKRRYTRSEKERVIRKLRDLCVSRIQLTGSTLEFFISGKKEQQPGMVLGPFQLAVQFAGKKIATSVQLDNSLDIWFANAGKVLNVHWLDQEIDIVSYRLIGEWESSLLELLYSASFPSG